MPKTLVAGIAICVFACDPSAERGAGTEHLYVSNESAGSISVIDTNSDRVVNTIAVGKRPRGLAIAPGGKVLYVALSGSPRGGPHVDESTLPEADKAADGIGVIDLASGRFLRKIAGGSDPECVAVTDDGKLLAVANEDAARTTLLDSESQKVVADVAVGGEPEGLRFVPNRRQVYVTSESDHRVDVIDTETQAVIAKIPTGERPRDIVFSKDGARAFISAEIGAAVDVVDAREHRRITSIPIPGTPRALPMGLALDEGRKRLYVSTGRAGRVAIVDTEKLRLQASIENVGERPWGIALNGDGSKLYTANGPSNDVSVIDTRALRVVRRIPVGERPWGLLLNQR